MDICDIKNSEWEQITVNEEREKIQCKKVEQEKKSSASVWRDKEENLLTILTDYVWSEIVLLKLGV